ncbi:DNA glycosylase AlkZ-like family protein [Clostridium sp. 'White wine YQ']|uniref:DNA glycosylase AlkZ-like family protein n=1 Tax=Clostridium sp. 'White wine YQ' TaxID=3027474 RepID=UPI002366B883|nr:crosslink repair DNA glycosylase YcaQ family protein [Clostridium sp. 'White wine YQ']MDD7794133.1 crosslink repair DNA glycosylase YcaQ family protein [Clostridium sp. 'White wine YQ']
MKIYEKQQICKYLVTYQHLSDDTELINKDKIVDYIKKVGCIQYDPLNVVGRNPDLVLQSRLGCYRKGDIEKYLYSDRSLFDVWDKNMSICSVSDWAYFERYRKEYLNWCNNHKDTIDKITEYLRINESACSSDFQFEEKVGWHYGPQRLAKAALECMCYAGLAVVHHKKGARRYYSLADKYIPEKYFFMKDPNDSIEDYYKWFVLRRINSIGILWIRPSDAWLGLKGFKSEERNNAFKALLNEGKISEIAVDGMKHKLYIATENLEVLQASIKCSNKSNVARMIAPLDNILWDRKLVKELFGFEYKWEVYTPAAERKYGYYVLPILCNDKFVGRIEMETDKKNKTLIVKNFWAEDDDIILEYRKAITLGIDRFKEYNLCDKVEIRCNI